MAKSARDSSLDAVKGFTILIVMLGHVLVLNKINDPVIYDWIKAGADAAVYDGVGVSVW